MPQTQDALLLREAVTAAKVGNKTAARQLLRQASVHNPNNELVWLWRASLSESPKEAIFYLGEVLRINPQNQKASAWLDKCKGTAPATAPAPEGPKPMGQGLSAPPEPKASAVPHAGNGTSPTTQGILRVTENVGTTTMRPADPAAPAVAARAGMGADLTPKPADTALRGRPTVVPFTAPATKASPVPAPQQQAGHKWRCPFCNHSAETQARRCPGCRAITVLEDLKEIEKNEGVQEKLVREALGRYEAIPAEQRSFEQNVHLALGHLNLREASAALPHLKAASAQKRSDWALMGVLDQIQWRKVILVVDDSLTIRKALSSILEKNDYRSTKPYPTWCCSTSPCPGWTATKSAKTSSRRPSPARCPS
jgi:twitching motility two-component system response regulator PilG